MQIRKTLFLILFTSTIAASAWGPTGHRVVGEIASRHLTDCTKARLDSILGPQSLAIISNWMDDIKSDPRYRSWNPWHYCTIPDDQTYAEAGTPSSSDIITKLHQLMTQGLPNSESEWEDETAIKMICHLVGDIHQPLHVGNGTDKGGNDFEVYWFGKKSNLHRVWDSGIITSTELSYTEYVQWIDHATPEQMADWSSDDVLVWAQESKQIRMSGIYPEGPNLRLGYQYRYQHQETVNLRLLQAGIRLAHVLNTLYGC